MLQSWADAEWFTSRPEVPQSITVTVFKVTGETNTDDLSPAPDAWSRPDIPLHALAMLKNPRPGITPEEDGKRGPMKFIEELQAPRATWSPTSATWSAPAPRASRATNSRAVVHRRGHPVRAEQALRRRLPGRQDRADLLQHAWKTPARCRSSSTSSKMDMGDVIELRPYEGKALKDGEVIAEFSVKSDVLFDEVRAGGRIPLIIGRGLTAKAREALGLPPSTLFRLPQRPADTEQGLHAGAEDGRPRLRPARRPGRAPRHLLRTEDDHRRLARTPPAR